MYITKGYVFNQEPGESGPQCTVQEFHVFQDEADKSLEYFKHICLDTLGEHFNMFNYDPEQRCDGNNIQPIYIKGKNLHLISEPSAIFVLKAPFSSNSLLFKTIFYLTIVHYRQLNKLHNLLYVFGAGQSVLATLLLLSPIYDF